LTEFPIYPIAGGTENSYTALIPVKRRTPELTANLTLGSKIMRLREQLREICDRHDIDLVYAFGSRAGEVKAFVYGIGKMDKSTTSDVDIGIKASPKRGAMSVREKVEVASEMEDLLGVERVDLVTLSEADSFLSANIVRGERIFSRDPYSAEEYELYILRRAGDLAPLEHERLSMIFTKAG
jgi:predicted nucleotidyltransferase